MDKEKSRAQILRDTIKHLILNNLNEYEWLIESKLYNIINEGLRDIIYKNNDVVVELRKLVLKNIIYKIVIFDYNNEKHYHYIKVQHEKRRQLRRIGDECFSVMREKMVEVINVPLPIYLPPEKVTDVTLSKT